MPADDRWHNTADPSGFREHQSGFPQMGQGSAFETSTQSRLSRRSAVDTPGILAAIPAETRGLDGPPEPGLRTPGAALYVAIVV